MKVSQSLLLPVLLSSPFANSYQISETIVGKDFYQHFNWQTLADPTHGRMYLEPLFFSTLSPIDIRLLQKLCRPADINRPESDFCQRQYIHSEDRP